MVLIGEGEVWAGPGGVGGPGEVAMREIRRDRGGWEIQAPRFRRE